MYKKILVPLDGSELSETILPQAVSVAKPSKAEIVLLRVHEPLEPAVRETLGGDLAEKLDTVNREEMENYLAKIARDLDGQGLKVSVVTVFGRPADTIIEYTGANAIDLIAMATHGRSGITKWAFGSVADKVLRLSPVPVLVGPVAGATRA
ncbi:universal stress protein [Dehalogenimonas sp. THU2]|uniref:universal stress protein n=1 Tax=Dehalogenimonas sp. THU2 TaxID=3151121 RepID=UPI00321867D0